MPTCCTAVQYSHVRNNLFSKYIICLSIAGQEETVLAHEADYYEELLVKDMAIADVNTLFE